MIIINKDEVFSKLNEYAKNVKTEIPDRLDENIPEWNQGRYYSNNDKTLVLHKEIIDFASYFSLTEKEIYLRKLVILRFQNIVSSIWPDAIVICFGSFSQGTSLSDGDLDLTIQNIPKDRDNISLLFELHDRMEKVNFFSKSRVLTTSFVPIIKCVESPFQIKLDISLNNNVSIIKNVRFKNEVDKYPSLLPISLFIKYFIDYKKLNFPYHGGINNFMLGIMILNVIQSVPEKDQFNCGLILLRFLDIYGNKFNYFTVGITSRNGGSLFNRISEKDINWSSPFSMTIEDNFNPGFYLGQCSNRILEIREIFKSAYKQLMLDIDSKQKILLAGIITINQNIQEKRQKSISLYDELIMNTQDSSQPLKNK